MLHPSPPSEQSESRAKEDRANRLRFGKDAFHAGFSSLFAIYSMAAVRRQICRHRLYFIAGADVAVLLLAQRGTSYTSSLALCTCSCSVIGGGMQKRCFALFDCTPNRFRVGGIDSAKSRSYCQPDGFSTFCCRSYRAHLPSFCSPHRVCSPSTMVLIYYV